jgi:hypothetical protein
VAATVVTVVVLVLMGQMILLALAVLTTPQLMAGLVNLAHGLLVVVAAGLAKAQRLAVMAGPA